MPREISVEPIVAAFAGAPVRNGLRNRLYLAVRQAILSGRLPAGAELPSSRSLARELGVARNTVLRAYELLLAEGYLEGRGGSGTFVSERIRAPQGTMTEGAGGNGQVAVSARGKTLLAHAASSRLQGGAFMPGIPDVSHFPFAVWRRILGRYLRPEQRHLAQYGYGGYGPLKTVLAQYLGMTRMMSCTPQQVVIVNGTHQAVDLIARVLADVGDRAWMEDPGYWGARNVLQAAGLEVVAQPVDGEGLAIRPEERERPPRLIFVSPSCQYPTGAVMSLGRRLDLLEYAERHGSWVIEDDYDNEMRFHSQPIASLFGLSRSQRVIYVGTFSKVLFPGLRLAYLVVPPSLAEAFTVANAELYREGRLPEQAALAEFIDDGHFSAHIRRMRPLYRERLETLRELLSGELGTAVSFLGGHAGLHLTVQFAEPLDDVAIAASALNEGVICRPLSRYSLEASTRRSGMVLGFAPVPVERMRRPVEILLRAIGAHRRPSGQGAGG
ncbi:PLP-dependent aminotransferase family protein [Tepidiphilus margaritifer]|uniref:MocR-like pyridoxine biosynthesis transcription factor PdxR n=1 Tax=Tepidiphilus margaritifer TaxID=203471 RepID=UPI00042625AD|nr:PLP-dependent aminotransferase family protein [Tepidiphilus margaritifer]